METFCCPKRILLFLNIILLSFSFTFSRPIIPKLETQNPSSPAFPSNFFWGAGTSAYQVEGAYLGDGKALNNWDVYTHKPGKILDGSNGDNAVDEYHRFMEDIELMVSLGINSYRFSISWARILPNGRYGDINLLGVAYYNKLINNLLSKGIEPVVSLNHYDIPQELEDRYGGWLSSESREDFAYLADVCFRSFGDRVKNWITFNEPNNVLIYTYLYGYFPPARCSSPYGNCTNGNSKTEPFIAAHNIILSHAAAVNIYRTKYQEKQGGQIGLTVQTRWYQPFTDSNDDKLATERAHSFFNNWFLDPVIYGEYPAEMRNILGADLPRFTEDDMKLLQMGIDFIGINHYTTFYVRDCWNAQCDDPTGNTTTVGYLEQLQYKNGNAIGEPTGMEVIFTHPPGMEKMITYLKERYNNTPIIITENGYCEMENQTKEESLNDIKRIEYLSRYLDAVSTAIRKGADVRGYFAWSLLDNFEWLYGFTKRFGLIHVDHTTLDRTPKLSATWYRNFIVSQKKTTSLLPKDISLQSS